MKYIGEKVVTISSELYEAGQPPIGNPFAGCGKIVFGDQFIGRRRLQQIITASVSDPNAATNIAIIGMPHVGKSSLLWHCLMHNRQTHWAKHLIPVWIAVGQIRDPVEFIKMLVRGFDDEWRRLSRVFPEQLDAGTLEERDRALDASTWQELLGHTSRFFEDVHSIGWRPVFILDEFDYIRTVFREATWAFQAIRELAYNPNYGVSYAIASRRPIHEIESQAGGVSNFDNIITKYHLARFDHDESLASIRRLSTVNLTLSESDEKIIQAYTGNHPYLIGMVCRYLAEQHLLGIPVSSMQACSWSGVGVSTNDLYSQLRDFLTDIDRLKPLLEIIFGPQLHVSAEDCDLLKSYGLIESNASADDSFRTFNYGFETFLRGVEHQVDLWPLWNQTERALRILLTNGFQVRYGDQWVNSLKQVRPTISGILESCASLREKEVRISNAPPNSNLLDFTEPRDLWPLLSCHWQDMFLPVLGEDKAYWQKRFETIVSVRRPLAHSREQVSNGKRLEAEGICRQIMTCIQKAKNTYVVKTENESLP